MRILSGPPSPRGWSSQAEELADGLSQLLRRHAGIPAQPPQLAHQAGVKVGQSHGGSDELGFEAAENPVHVHDLQATVLHLLGFNHEKLTYKFQGRDFRLTDVHGSVVRELLA